MKTKDLKRSPEASSGGPLQPVGSETAGAERKLRMQCFQKAMAEAWDAEQINMAKVMARAKALRATLPNYLLTWKTFLLSR
jgi:hypothetical protein